MEHPLVVFATSNKVFMIALGAIALGGGAYFFVRTGPAAHTSREADRARVRAETVSYGRLVYEKIPMRPIGKETSVPELIAVLSRAELTQPWSPAAGDKDSLLAEAAEFIQQRFASPDLERYRRWRQDKGYSPRSYAQMLPVASLYYENYYQERPPASGDATWLFSRLWDAQVSRSDPRATITAVGDDGHGLVIGTGTLSAGNLGRRPFAGHEPSLTSLDAWLGTYGSASPPFWDSVPSDKQLINSGRVIHYADVGFIATFANGSRHPVFLTYYWDSASRKWLLQFISQYNFADSDAVVLIW